MKSAVVLVALAATASGLSTCVLNCQSKEASTSGCDSDYNTTACYCDNDDFATNVKACLYEADCDSDVSAFYTYRESFCGDDEASSQTDTNETISDQGGVLGTCVLGCQSSAASDAGCSSNYNETSCYCDNDDFATAVKVCLYQNCSTEVPIFYNYRSSVCGSDNSSEYLSSVEAGNPTAGIATSTAASTASITSGTASASATGSSSGATSHGVMVSCLLAMVACVTFAIYL